MSPSPGYDDAPGVASELPTNRYAGSGSRPEALVDSMAPAESAVGLSLPHQRRLQKLAECTLTNAPPPSTLLRRGSRIFSSGLCDLTNPHPPCRLDLLHPIPSCLHCNTHHRIPLAELWELANWTNHTQSHTEQDAAPMATQRGRQYPPVVGPHDYEVQRSVFPTVLTSYPAQTSFQHDVLQPPGRPPGTSSATIALTPTHTAASTPLNTY